MAKVIKYDFKNKKKIEGYVKYNWRCACCQAVTTYDSRQPINFKRLEVSIDIPRMGTYKVSFCEQCVTEMHTCLIDEQEGYI